MEESYFYVDNGKKKVKCRGLFTYHSDDYDRDYILYTDDIAADGKGNANVYASIYDPDAAELTLTEIEDDEEFKMLIQVFAEANQG